MYLHTSLIVKLQGNLCISSNTKVIVDHFEGDIHHSFVLSPWQCLKGYNVY